MEKYNFSEIEAKWRKVWDKEKYGISEDFSNKPKHYHLVEFPYPSGVGLHVGHCMGYGASDAYCRMKRMQNFNVMYPIGWDAFGLPTENYAIRTGIHPSKATADSIAIFKDQIKTLGYSFDWSREINTTNPEYYKWTQWIFLQFYKHGYKGDSPDAFGAVPSSKSKGRSPLIEVAGDDTTTPRLAYQQEMPVNWCPSCKIGLANEEVISGACERCDTQTEKRMQKQWLLRITAYADRLIDDLATVDYLDKIKTQQINWIGKSEGAEILFRVIASETKQSRKIAASPSAPRNDTNVLEVFTTRPDTLFGATYMVLAPEHPLVEELKDQITNYEEVIHYIQQARKKSDLERTELQKEKTGVKIRGIKAINPVNNEEIPIFIADYVLSNYGTGAVMAVPAHDERDFEFARKYNLSIRNVVSSVKLNTSVILSDSEESRSDAALDPSPDIYRGQDDILETAYEGDGIVINSDFLNGLLTSKAKKKITHKLKEAGTGNFAVNYKLRDWIFSRQHYWGEPIPIIHCKRCGIVPMDEKDLPLTLPDVENYQPTDTGESPLAKISDWVNTTCPKCGGPAKRETDTMPNWAGSSWYYLRYCDPRNANSTSQESKPTYEEKLASPDKLKYWLPVDIYNGGMEHTTLHLLYSRFWHKFLYDLGVVPGAEPYAKRIAHGIILGPDGQKMSKSRGNVINPDDMIKKFGADTLRAYIMFIGPYDQESAWSTAGIQGVFRFMNRVWHNSSKVTGGRSPEGDGPQVLVKLNQTVAGVTDDLENFRMNTVVSKLMEMNNAIDKSETISRRSFETYLKLLFPVCPHIVEELWRKLGNKDLIESNSWPIADKNYLIAEKIEIVVQINGKVRDKLVLRSDISDEELKEAALASKKVQALISDREILKTIVVPKKLVSIVTR